MTYMDVPDSASRLHWRLLCERLDESGALTADTRLALEARLDSWPDRTRRLPGRWLRALGEGREHPALGLARSAEVTLQDPARSLAPSAPWHSRPWTGHPWATCASLGGLRDLRVHDEERGDECAEAVARSPFLTQLTHLSLASGVTARGASVLASSPSLVSLRTLDLGRNRVGEAGVRALASSPHLQQLAALHLGRNALDAGAVSALSSGFPALRRLDLDFAGLTGPEVRRLVESGRLAGLRELNLSHNDLGHEGAEALAACADLRSLEVLFLHGCRLDDAAALALLSSPHLGALRNLALSDNALTLRSVEALERCAPLASLTELDVCHNPFPVDEAEARLRACPTLRALGRLCV